MNALRSACAAAAFVTLTLGTSFAFADEATAEQMFQDGLAAMKKNDFTTACEAFSKSNRADPSPGTQINLAVCFEKQKKWASAWTWYRSAAGLAEQRSQAARQKTAEESANRLKPQIHYVVIAVKDPPGDMTVKRDGAEVIVTLSGKDIPLPIDPGDHTIDITSSTKKPFTKTVTMPDNGNTDRVDVTLEDLPPDQTPAKPAGNTVIVERTEEAPRDDGSTQRTIGVIVGGVGILTGLAALGVYVLARGQASDRDEKTSEATTLMKTDPIRSQNTITNDNAAAVSDNKAAKNDELIAAVLAGGAVVMLGVGAVLYFTAPKPNKPKSGWLMPTPLVTPHFGGFGLTGTF